MAEQVAQYQDPSIDPAFFKAAEKALGDAPAEEVEQVSDDAPVSSDAEEAVVQDHEGTDESPQSEQDGEEQSAQEPLHTVVINGQSEAVPLSELIAGYQRQQDYSAKSREVASERKQVETLRAEVSQLRDAEAEKLQMLEAALRPALPTQQQLNQALAANDIAAYARMKNAIDQYTSIQAESANLEREKAERSNAEMQERLKSEAEKLYALMPELKKDDAKNALVGYLVKAGFSDSEINEIADARQMAIAEKARRYDDLMAKKPDAMRKVAETPKVVKQSTRMDTGSIKAQGIKEAKVNFYNNPTDDNAMIGFFKNFV